MICLELQHHSHPAAAETLQFVLEEGSQAKPLERLVLPGRKNSCRKVLLLAPPLADPCGSYPT